MRNSYIPFLLAVCVGCASAGRPNHIEMNVQAFADPEISIAQGSSFATVLTGATKDELLEKELLFLVRSRLEAKGLRYEEKAPDFLVAVSGFMGSYDKYVPPSTVYSPIPGSITQTTNVNGNAGGVPIYGTATSTTTGTSYIPISRRGYTHAQYTRIIDILVAKPVNRDGKAAVQSVWSGRVESTGDTGDLLLVAPPLVDELFTEFPRRSGRDPRRSVKWHPPSR
jgi:hypothetical protein